MLVFALHVAVQKWRKKEAGVLALSVEEKKGGGGGIDGGVDHYLVVNSYGYAVRLHVMCDDRKLAV